MKARVKATGEIKEVSRGIYSPYQYVDKEGRIYTEDELEELSEGGGVIFIDETPDYWTRLEHTYAGMAMQGIMSYIEQITPKEGRSYCDEIVDISLKVAHALVEKARYEENPKELEGLKKELEALKIEKTILENKIKLLTEESK